MDMLVCRRPTGGTAGGGAILLQTSRGSTGRIPLASDGGDYDFGSMNRAFDRAERNRDERRAARYMVRDQPTGSSASRPAHRRGGKTSSCVGSIRKRTPIRGKTSALRMPRISGGRPMFPVGGNGSVAFPTIAQRLCISRRARCHAVFAPGEHPQRRVRDRTVL